MIFPLYSIAILLLSNLYFFNISDIDDPLDEIAPIINGPAEELEEEGTLIINEGELIVFNFTSNEPVSWSISGGPDASLFNISDVGELSFLSTPDFIFSNSGDDHNNYEVEIQAKDESPLENITTDTVFITIEDQNAPILENAIVNYEGTKVILYFRFCSTRPDSNSISFIRFKNYHISFW